MDVGPIARAYRWLEYAAFGRTLERSRFAYVDTLREAKRVLILGEGDGRMLERLLQAAPEARFDVVEISPRMIELASARLGKHAARVRFLCGDARTLDWGQVLAGEQSYDAVVACYFLDCFRPHDARALIRSATRSLLPGGRWVVAEFAQPPSGWRRWHAVVWLALMYRFFLATTGLRTQQLVDVEQLLTSECLHCEQRRAWRAGLVTASVWRRMPY